MDLTIDLKGWDGDQPLTLTILPPPPDTIPCEACHTWAEYRKVHHS